MKKLLTILVIFVALIGLAPWWGCAPTQQSPQRVTFNAASTTVITVDAAMKAWASYAVGERAAAAGDNSRLASLAAKEAKVKGAYQQYQTAALQIVTAQAGLTNSPSASLIVTTALTSASGPLIGLISQLMTK